MGPIKTTSIETPITKDNLPDSQLWEEDGACWRAIQCDELIDGTDWRWAPLNAKALAKEGPEGPMIDHIWPSKLGLTSD